MRSLNRVMLIGHLAADVDYRQTKGGVPVANFPIAINRVIIGKNGEKTETVDFHRVVVWRGLADVCAEYLAKGIAVYVDGRLVNRSFEDKEGNKHYRTEVVADNVNFLTWKKSKSGKGEVSLEALADEDKADEETDVEDKEKVAV
ncbi:MAG: single-stranded DNA-binding protein [Candidatus Lokiarchaeota archaeon]|nr:single-stranded DNA-binding protein [Candidatus Lokiarchaeota archaeon]